MMFYPKYYFRCNNEYFCNDEKPCNINKLSSEYILTVKKKLLLPNQLIHQVVLIYTIQQFYHTVDTYILFLIILQNYSNVHERVHYAILVLLSVEILYMRLYAYDDSDNKIHTVICLQTNPK